MVFTAPQRLCQECSRVGDGDSRPKPEVHYSAQKTVRDLSFIPCFQNPLTWFYVGQTGRCLNDRLSKHFYLLAATVWRHLATHCMKWKKQQERLLQIEAFFTPSLEGLCGSAPSVALADKEVCFLQPRVIWVALFEVFQHRK